ncbi:unnamed protein product, partial [Polarella glacialis]
ELPMEVVGEWLSRDDHQRYVCIDLPSKKISDDTAMLINSLAMRCRRLHTLKLGGNRIGDEGAASLAMAMPHLSAITHLDLSSNSITGKGADNIAGAFLREQVGGSSSSRSRAPGSENGSASALPGLEDAGRQGGRAGGTRLLDLSHNPLEDSGVEAVARHLRHQARLRLRGVNCTHNGLDSLLRRK